MSKPLIKIREDTREQQPLTFDGLACEVVRDTIHVFDYALDGDQDNFAIERKSIPDLVGAITTKQGWERERAKIRRAAFSPVIYVVEGRILDLMPVRPCWCFSNPTCEFCLGKGFVGYDYSRRQKSVTSQFVYHRITEMIYEHHVAILFADSRIGAACMIEGLLRRRWEHLEFQKKMHKPVGE